MLDRNVNINVSCAANSNRDKNGQYGRLLSDIRRPWFRRHDADDDKGWQTLLQLDAFTSNMDIFVVDI